MARLSREDRMTVQALSDRGQSNRELARLLGVTEGAVRYHRRRQAQAADGPAPTNVAALYAWLVAEHDYPGSLRSLQRYVRRVFPAPARRARRRVETPPGT